MYRINDKKSAIREIKKYLYALSRSIHPSIRRTTIDGVFDEETRGAVIDFQKIMGYNTTGIVDFETFTALYNEYLRAIESKTPNNITSSGGFPLSVGDMNEDVRLLHIFVNELAKIYTTVEDVGTSSYYSNESAAAILALSKIFMMDESGVADKIMMKRIIYDVKNSTNMF